MSKEYKDCEKIIRKLLIQEKKLIRQLKEIQITKMKILLILTKGDDNK